MAANWHRGGAHPLAHRAPRLGRVFMTDCPPCGHMAPNNNRAATRPPFQVSSFSSRADYAARYADAPSWPGFLHAIGCQAIPKAPQKASGVRICAHRAPRQAPPRDPKDGGQMAPAPNMRLCDCPRSRGLGQVRRPLQSHLGRPRRGSARARSGWSQTAQQHRQATQARGCLARPATGSASQ